MPRNATAVLSIGIGGRFLYSEPGLKPGTGLIRRLTLFGLGL